MKNINYNLENKWAKCAWSKLQISYKIFNAKLSSKLNEDFKFKIRSQLYAGLWWQTTKCGPKSL